tara:strand:+ start:988 stop:1509 length:522 start_codon:yes stop_codon:yes gene_type:complete
MRLKKTEAALEAFKNFVIQQARSRLTKSKKNVSKELYNSLKGNVKVMPNSINVDFQMEDYGLFQDKGVSGTEKKYNTPYSYTTKMPPVKPLSDWAQSKNIRLRDAQGKYKKGNYNTIGFLIARSIYRKGIKPSLFFTKPFEQGFKKLPDELINSFGLDVDDFLAFTFNEDRLR